MFSACPTFAAYLNLVARCAAPAAVDDGSGNKNAMTAAISNPNIKAPTTACCCSGVKLNILAFNWSPESGGGLVYCVPRVGSLPVPNCLVVPGPTPPNILGGQLGHVAGVCGC